MGHFTKKLHAGLIFLLLCAQFLYAHAEAGCYAKRPGYYAEGSDYYGRRPDYLSKTGGYGYRASLQAAQCFAPAIALAAIALAGILAVGLHKRSGTKSTQVHSSLKQ